jgi:hypothetical protein
MGRTLAATSVVQRRQNTKLSITCIFMAQGKKDKVSSLDLGGEECRARKPARDV